ncbi:Slp family lipoprotein [Nitrosococcus wardiae]|uniref:Slp family lipoprotein n=1 Tax=Nitrosococcus wardiae TaxID=1814290 RepID=A0A4V1AVR1_9GAMM|nr:Slp/YeaY family lipoprotein [Nitrosococcus wardiae]QBQ54015.1 hypothetical protein E3U44_05465 [Nitrosococcus wardiae]
MRLFFLVIAALGLSSCATAPKLETAGAAQDLAPAEVAAHFDAYQGQRVVWGGLIVNHKNLEERTMLEVLAYPLSANLEPKTQAQPLGRFILQSDSFLEPIDYSPGREMTVVGSLTHTTTGRIGEMEYTYPVLRPEQIHLWPREQEAGGGGRTGFHFGIGVGIGL